MSDIKNGSSLVNSGAVNFGNRSDDYATFRPGFPPRFYDKIAASINEYRTAKASGATLKTAPASTVEATNAAATAAAASTSASGSASASAADAKAFEWKGAKVLDVGTGPGVLALEVAARGATVVGLDIAPNQIAAAGKRAKELKLDSLCTFSVATAEVTGQPDSAFDVVMAGQCWPWFKHDIAMKELRRVLKPGGVLVVGQFCYLPQRSTLAKDSEDLVMALNTKWRMANFDGLYPSQIDQLVVRGQFELIEQFTFDHPQYFTHAGWRGRMRTCNGVGSGGLSDADVDKFDAALAALLKDKYPAEPQLVWHRIWGVVVHA